MIRQPISLRRRGRRSFSASGVITDRHQGWRGPITMGISIAGETAGNVGPQAVGQVIGDSVHYRSRCPKWELLRYPRRTALVLSDSSASNPAAAVQMISERTRHFRAPERI